MNPYQAISWKLDELGIAQEKVRLSFEKMEIKGDSGKDAKKELHTNGLFSIGYSIHGTERSSVQLNQYEISSSNGQTAVITWKNTVAMAAGPSSVSWEYKGILLLKGPTVLKTVNATKADFGVVVHIITVLER